MPTDATHKLSGREAANRPLIPHPASEASPPLIPGARSAPPKEPPVDISGLIIDTQEGEAERVAAAVAALDGVEVLQTVPPSRVVILVEAGGIDPSMEVSNRIWAIPGVAAINLACHYHNVEELEAASSSNEGACEAPRG